jgi:membrane peptidoglycan carboxypeptidase
MAIISNSILSIVAGRWYLVGSLFLAFGLVFLLQPIVGQAEGLNDHAGWNNDHPMLELASQFGDQDLEIARLYDRNGNELSWYSHFAMLVLQQTTEILGVESIYRDGLAIHTTLDPTVQALAEAVIAAGRLSLEEGGANNAAMVVVDPVSGEVLVLVGSVDFEDEIVSGQINMALVPREPGSALQPFVYLFAMEKGWTPATLIWDVPTSYSGTSPYEPVNYDRQFRGPVLARPALGNLYNVPAVKTLEFVGVCDFIENLQKMGLISLQDPGCAGAGIPQRYGLGLAHGGGEVILLEMAAAFGTLASQGRYLKPVTIHRIENRAGETLFENQPTALAQAQVVRPEHAYLVSDILSDNNARVPAFGRDNSLIIPGHRVAVTMGTSFHMRDAWIIGYTPEVVTAVWVGNTDYNPFHASGYALASPIWNSFMTEYLAGRTPVDFTRPSGVVDIEICAISGTRPGPNCHNRIIERFVADQPPLDSLYDFIHLVSIDLWTGLQANQYCTESVYDASFFRLLVNGNEDVLTREYSLAQHWLEETDAGQAWASRHSIAIPLQLLPEDACEEGTPRPQITITEPQAGDILAGEINIVGSVNAPGFTGYQVEYGLGDNPSTWRPVQEQRQTAVENDLLATWDTSTASATGPVTLRVLAFGPDNPYTPEADPAVVEARVPVNLFDPEANTSSINWFSIVGFALGLAVLAVSGVLLWRWRSAVPTTVSSDVCPQCGTPNPSNARFCKQCGRRLD